MSAGSEPCGAADTPENDDDVPLNSRGKLARCYAMLDKTASEARCVARGAAQRLSRAGILGVRGRGTLPRVGGLAFRRPCGPWPMVTGCWQRAGAFCTPHVWQPRSRFGRAKADSGAVDVPEAKDKTTAEPGADAGAAEGSEKQGAGRARRRGSEGVEPRSLRQRSTLQKDEKDKGGSKGARSSRAAEKPAGRGTGRGGKGSGRGRGRGGKAGARGRGAAEPEPEPEDAEDKPEDAEDKSEEDSVLVKFSVGDSFAPGDLVVVTPVEPPADEGEFQAKTLAYKSVSPPSCRLQT
jgi:hypothetical protein